MQDWVAWHSGYDDPASPLRTRLDRVTWHLARALDQAPPGPIQLLSLCAGQGRDVLEVLPDHPRRADVTALLVEADAENAAMARQGAADAGLAAVRVRQADASVVANFADVLPAYVLLLAGIFGNVCRRGHQADRRRGVRPVRARRDRDLDPASPPAGPHRPDPLLVPGQRIRAKWPSTLSTTSS